MFQAQTGYPQLKMSEQDTVEALSVLKDLKSHTGNALASVKSLISRADELITKKGLSFFDLKNQLMLNYLSNLSHIILQKLSGNKIEGNLSIENLVEIRTVLEKMRPIESKLKYKVDKLLKAASTGNVDKDDPLQFRANPANFAKESSDESEMENDDDDEKKAEKSKVYVPPKLAAVYYDDMSLEEKKKKSTEQARKRALTSSVMQELRREFDQGPEEIIDTTTLRKARTNKQLKERTEYEEDHMIRLSVTKSDKKRLRELETTSSFAHAANFEGVDEDGFRTPKKKRKSASKGSKKKKRGFRKKK